MTVTTQTHCGTTPQGADVYATEAFLKDYPFHEKADAVRYAERYGRCHPNYGQVTDVLITEYGPRDFGPSGRYWLDSGVVGWFTCPGGMPHGGFYNVVAGVGPASALDAYPRPVSS